MNVMQADTVRHLVEIRGGMLAHKQESGSKTYRFASACRAIEARDSLRRRGIEAVAGQRGDFVFLRVSE